MNNTTSPLDLVLEKLPDAVRYGDGFKACCPAHDDHKPSLAITESDGKVLLHCWTGCTTEAVVAAMGLRMRDLFPAAQPKATARKTTKSKPIFKTAEEALAEYGKYMGKPVAVWTYHDKDGNKVGAVARWNNDNGTKEYRPVSLNCTGWKQEAMAAPRPLYRLPEVLRADGRTYVCEGEKCADAMRRIGLVATTSPNGAQSPAKADWSVLAGKTEVVIVPDNDPAGEQYATVVGGQICKLSPRPVIKILRLSGLPDGGDIADWLYQRDATEPAALRDQITSMADAVEAEEGVTDNECAVPNEAPDDPHRLARLFLEKRGTSMTGEITLWYWRDEWWTWDGFAYRVVAQSELSANLTTIIKQEFDRLNLEQLAKPRDDEEPPPTVRKITTGLLTNVLLALSSSTILSSRIQQPCWLYDDEPFPADEVFATTTGLIHLPSLVAGMPSTLPPSPQFFSAGAVDYGFEANADCPEWLKFLASVWPNDPETIACLQEWFGYLLLPDTRQHKLLLLIGAPRSGKGAIGRILKRLIGERSFASPTLSSLASPFGLWPLFGKTVALIPDARLSGRDDAIATTERLLSISGEDPQDIHRKCLPTITGVTLAIRFVLMTNELPNLYDSSGAIANRVIMLRTTRSWLGKEDKRLDEKLQRELSGILNWSISGWQRLQQRGRFSQPATAQEMLEDLHDLTSPVSQFVRERCDINPEREASVDDLFSAWLNWCAEHGRKKTGTQQTFAKDLHAKVTTLVVSQPRFEGSRIRVYKGIGIVPGTRWHASRTYGREGQENDSE